MKSLKVSIILISILCLFSSCGNKDDIKPVEYKKDALQEISYSYPKTYKEDYRNDSQVTYLFNKNEGIIFIIRWDEDVETDMTERGTAKTVNDIDGYYWKDDTDEYTFAFNVDTANDKQVTYFICADNEEAFWNIVKSIKIKN